MKLSDEEREIISEMRSDILTQLQGVYNYLAIKGHYKRAKESIKPYKIKADLLNRILNESN